MEYWKPYVHVRVGYIQTKKISGSQYRGHAKAKAKTKQEGPFFVGLLSTSRSWPHTPLSLPPLHPQHDIEWYPPKLRVKVRVHLLARVTNAPMAQDEDGVGRGAHVGVKLCVVCVATRDGVLVEGARGCPHERALMQDHLGGKGVLSALVVHVGAGIQP